MSGNAREAGRSTLDRLFALLDVFDGSDLTLGEIAERADLPPSTTHRMLAALSEWSAIERATSGRYRVGVRLWELGTTAATPRHLRSAALPGMQELHQATKENVQLAIEDRGGALVVEKVTGAHAVPTVTELGGRLPLHATGVGKVLLAHANGDLLEHMHRNGLRRYTAYTLAMPGRLASSLSQTRDSGVGAVREEMTLGASSLAVPIVDAIGRTTAALGIVAHSRFELGRHVGRLRRAADEVSRLMIEQDTLDDLDCQTTTTPATAFARRPVRSLHHRSKSNSGHVAV